MKKKMYSVIILVVLMFFVCILTCAAETKQYTFCDINLSVDIPDDYVVFTRDTDENYILQELGMSKEELLDKMEESDIYLSAIDAELQNEIIITSSDMSFIDYNNISDDDLLKLQDEMKDTYAENGFSYTKSEIYNNEHMKFVKLYGSNINENEKNIFLVIVRYMITNQYI